MKKFLLVALVLVSTFMLVGCGKKGLVGKWASEQYSGQFVYTFNEDGTGNYDAMGTVREFTYQTNEDKISILYKGDTVPFESTFTLDGDKLNVKDSLGNDTIYNRK